VEQDRDSPDDGDAHCSQAHATALSAFLEDCRNSYGLMLVSSVLGKNFKGEIMRKLMWLGAPALLLALAGVVALAQGRVERVQERPDAERRQDGAQRQDAEKAEKAEKAEIGKAAPDFTLKNAKGDEVKLSDFKGKIVVLEWINFDCPWCKAHYDGKEELIKQQNKIREDGGAWLYICSSGEGKQGHFTGDALNERLKREKIDGTHYLIDADGKVGRMYSAITTPHVFVIDTEGVLRYHGAMDNLPAQRGGAEAVSYIKQVIETLKAGEELETTNRRPYG
jgi:peroxiredoxin